MKKNVYDLKEITEQMNYLNVIHIMIKKER